MRNSILSIIILAVLFFSPGALNYADAETLPPGLMFSTVLNGLKMDYKTGDFYLKDIQAVFLPEAASTSVYMYDPGVGGKLWAILTDGEGAEMGRYDFYAEMLKAPYWLLNSYKLMDNRTGDSPPNGRMHLDKGDYNLDFYVEGDHFYHFPFSVDFIPSSDPFTPGDYYFLESDWSNWGYFYYYDANPEQSLQWKIWLRNKAHETYKDSKIRIEITGPNGLLCTSRENMTFSLKPDWVRYEFDMIFPMEGTSGGAYFKAKDLLGTDGSYTLTMKVNDEMYGTWKFKVSGGTLQPDGRTLRDEADPFTFVEGGKDAFWYGKS